MIKLDTITLDFARQVIEEETGTPLDIKAPSAGAPKPAAGVEPPAGAADARLVARDDKKNPLISTFDWTEEATQRIFRVPAGFMRNKTQERIEEVARERAAAQIDLALVEEGIEIGKKMMAEMIATYNAPAAGAGGAAPQAGASRPAPTSPGDGNGRGYLNEVSPLNARGASDPHQ
jgi:hypothetical protein